MRELRELVLPHLVEARDRRSLYAERAGHVTPDRLSPQSRSRSYSSADATMRTASPSTTPPRLTTPTRTMTISIPTPSTIATPITPVFTPRTFHSRFPSGASSLASSPNMRESIDGFIPPAKRPLTEVREEPADARDEAPEVPAVPAMTRSADRGYPRSRADSSPLGIDIPRGPHPTAARSYTDDGSMSARTPSLDHASSRNYCDEAAQAQAAQPAEQGDEYNWLDDLYDFEGFDYSAAKRRRGDESPRDAAGAAGGAFNSLRTLSRRLTRRKDVRQSSIPDSFAESIASRSRASSMRTPSIADFKTDTSAREPSHFKTDSGSREANAPTPTPERVLIETKDPAQPQVETASTDVEDGYASDESCSRTPLLPPVKAPLHHEANTDSVVSPLQSPRITSPLQSPKIAEPMSPVGSEVLSSPRESNIPPLRVQSPGLSKQPSMVSLRGAYNAGHYRTSHQHPTSPSAADQHADIPPILLSHPQDEWSQKLGHANFTIHPEPYALGPHPTGAATAQLAADWALARQHFARHLASTGEHYGTTCKVYQLTRAKWTAVDASWRANYNAAAAALSRGATPMMTIGPVVQTAERPTKVPSPVSTTAITHTSPRVVLRPLSPAAVRNCDVKFPAINLEDIVGPMVRVQRPPQPSPPRASRKRGFWRFLQGILPDSMAIGRREAVC